MELVFNSSSTWKQENNYALFTECVCRPDWFTATTFLDCLFQLMSNMDFLQPLYDARTHTRLHLQHNVQEWVSFWVYFTDEEGGTSQFLV